MGYFKITNVIIERNKILYKMDISKENKKFFVGKDFFVEYEEDLDNIDYSIGIIPILCNIMPIAWFSNSDIYIERIDINFEEAIIKIKNEFEKMYNIKFNSKLIFKNKIKNYSYGSFDTTFFSGGVDSLSTLIAKKDKIKYLTTIWGADIKLSDNLGWNKVKCELIDFSKQNKVENIFIKSNLREFLNEKELNNSFKKIIIDGWWPRVQHALGMAGLLAPIVNKKDLRMLFIPSSYTKDFNKPWGSDPRIDNNIRFMGLRTYHEGYELSRQGKIKNIANYIKNKDKNLFIRVCWSSSGGGNCCKCEKCCRTIVGLSLANIDYRNNGFLVEENFFQYVKFMLKNSQWLFSDDEIFMWKDIQKNINLDNLRLNKEEKEFFYWLKDLDIDLIRANQLNLKNRIIRKIRNLVINI